MAAEKFRMMGLVALTPLCPLLGVLLMMAVVDSSASTGAGERKQATSVASKTSSSSSVPLTHSLGCFIVIPFGYYTDFWGV